MIEQPDLVADFLHQILVVRDEKHGAVDADVAAVAQRTREFAIRAAVGASRARLIASVMREGLVLSGVGIATGTGLALASGE